MDPVLIHSLDLKNILSFGPESPVINLGALNVIIGPNAAGKSNFIETISLLNNAPGDVIKTIREGGGARAWLFKGQGGPAHMNAVVSNAPGHPRLRYVLSFGENQERFELRDERIECEKPNPGQLKPYFFYHFEDGRPVLNVNEEVRSLRKEEVDFRLSILAQRKDPLIYPEITHLGHQFSQIRVYKNWQVGQWSPPRHPCSIDMDSDILETDFRNLPLVLNELRLIPQVKTKMLGLLRELYEDADDFSMKIMGPMVQLQMLEKDVSIPAVRLSDGTLRFLCLLAILCDPNPGSLICIEEPELGLHPDIIPVVADLLVEASRKAQIIITTHSVTMVDCMTEHPESILVCEKGESGTEMKRLDPEDLDLWLKDFRLGHLWTSGDIGGNRH